MGVKVCKWNPNKHDISCPFHSVRKNEDGSTEETFDGGNKWIDLPIEEYEEIEGSKELSSENLADHNIEIETEENDNSGRDGHTDYSTIVRFDDNPIIILSEINEEKAIKQLKNYLAEKLNINVSEEELKNSFIDKIDKKPEDLFNEYKIKQKDFEKITQKKVKDYSNLDKLENDIKKYNLLNEESEIADNKTKKLVIKNSIPYFFKEGNINNLLNKYYDEAEEKFIHDKYGKDIDDIEYEQATQDFIDLIGEKEEFIEYLANNYGNI